MALVCPDFKQVAGKIVQDKEDEKKGKKKDQVVGKEEEYKALARQIKKKYEEENK